jgi:hypothetical protein
MQLGNLRVRKKRLPDSFRLFIKHLRTLYRLYTFGNSGLLGRNVLLPFVGEAGQSQDEFAGYSALMCFAAQKINNIKYASLITGLIDFIRWLTLPDGQICDVADSSGKLWRSKIDETTEGGFLILPIAIALLGGAGS